MRNLVVIALTATLALFACGAAHQDLRDAIRFGTPQQAASLLRSKSSPNVMIDDGEQRATPLMVAAVAGKVDTIKALIEAGADPNFADSDGRTALLEACAMRQPGTLAALIAAGANPRHENKKHRSCVHELHGADRSRAPRKLEVLKVLGAAGVSMEGLTAPQGWGAGFAGEPFIHWVVAHDHEAEIVSYYFEQGGVAIDRLDSEGRTPLAAAAAADDSMIVRYLLEKGARADVRDAKGRDVLATAAEYRALAKDDPGESSINTNEQQRPVVAAALAPGLELTDRLAAMDAAQAKVDAASRERSQRQYAAEREGRRQLERERAAAEKRRAAPFDPDANMPAMCLTPEMKACRAKGRTCEKCFYDSLPKSSTKSPTTCSAGFVACGSTCCGTGYHCCVGTTSANHGVETCRHSTDPCKQGWAAEQPK